MRWPFRRKPKTEMVFVGGNPWDRPQSSGVTVVAAPEPPAPPAEPVAQVPTPAPDFVRPTPDPNTVPVVGRHEAQRAEPADPGVRLGFADGSVLMLPDDDPTATALLAAAARLTSGDPPRGRASG
ncbi:MAG: hypothetical protein LC750_07065 [Actinobacteria bacterium]|nr:hypothetical protein [Actinomycetota bacterium]